MAPACRVVPPCFIGTELNLCVYACVCVLSSLSSVSLPHNAETQGHGSVCTGDSALCKLALKPGLTGSTGVVCLVEKRLGVWVGSQTSVSTCEECDQ